MHLLNDTPVFLEFLKRSLKLMNVSFRNRYLHKQLYLYSQCRCEQKDCGTVTLKSRRKLKEEFENDFFDASINEAFIYLHTFENGFIEFEVISDKKLPYKKEIDKFFKNIKYTDDKYPRLRKRIKALNKKEKVMLHKFFRNPKACNIKSIIVGEI